MLGWVFFIAIAIFLFLFLNAYNKDNDDLIGTTLEEKFSVIVNQLNHEAFNGTGVITTLSIRECHLFGTPGNQHIVFHYSTGHLTVTWRYKYFQKEVILKRDLRGVRNLSIFEQERLSKELVSEMREVIRNHQNKVLAGQ